LSASDLFSVEGLRARGMFVPDVRYRREIDLFARSDARGAPPTGGILFVGDSDFTLWRKDGLFGECFRGMRVLNRGFGGARSWEVLVYFREAVEPSRPATIVYNAGDNDLFAGPGVTPEKVRLGFELFLEAVRTRLPETRRVACMALHRAPDREDDRARQDEVNRLLAGLCSESPLAEFVDYAPLLLDADGKLRPECFLPDGLHYSPQFYREWGAFLRPLLEKTVP
jgi:lysophospholipase L1-like esterase